MTMGDKASGTAATTVKLSFGETFSGAFSTVFGRFGQFARVAAVPLILSVVILLIDFSLRAMTFTGTLPIDPEGVAAALLELVTGLLALLPLAFLGINVTRLSFLGAQPGLLPSPVLGRRTFVYAGYFLLLSVVFIVLAVIGFIAGIALLQTTDLGEAAGVVTLMLGGTFGFCLLFYLLLRFSLVLPAVSLDEKLGLGGSWRLTRGGSVKLLGVFLLLFLLAILAVLVGSIATGGGEIRLGTPELVIPEDAAAASDWMAIVRANLPRNLWNLVANFIIFAMSCGALTAAYRQLSGAAGPHQEILERFE